jgi:hypothetical protein
MDMTAQDDLTLALAGLDREVAAVAAFDRARDLVVDLIEVRADPAAVYEALGEVYERLEGTRTAYFHLEALMISAGWSMERPEQLPVELRRAIEAQLPAHERHLARTAEAEAVVECWLADQEERGTAQRFWAGRQVTEERYARRARRRRGGSR